MGLRERKVERTRTALATAAIELFLAEGYEATTMEQIAERAELGSSTLYRHFPTKDLLLLDWFVRRFDLAAALRERPDDEPLPIALRRALVALLELPSPTGSHQLDVRLRRLIDTNPGPRARLWDFVVGVRDALQQEVGRRMGRPADDLEVVTTARFAALAHEIVAERIWSGDGDEDAVAELDRVLHALHRIEPVLPDPNAG